MRPGDILGRIFYVVTEINHRIIGSSEFKRNLNGCCGIAYGKKSWRKSLLKYCASARNLFKFRLRSDDKKNLMETKIFKLNTPCSRVIRGFLVAYGKKSLGEIFNKIWPMARNQSSEFRRKYNL